MNDWQVGDKAVCIKSGKVTRKGAIYTVRMILHPGEIDPEDGRYDSELLLRFVGVAHGRGGWSGHTRFRKIRPDEHQACEEEFVTLLKRVKRPVSA